GDDPPGSGPGPAPGDGRGRPAARLRDVPVGRPRRAAPRCVRAGAAGPARRRRVTAPQPNVTDTVPDKLHIPVAGQTPPPHHGQAIMIEKMLQGRYEGVVLHHVRMGFSETIEDVGGFRLRKVVELVRVIGRIVAGRLVHGARVLYYPPAGPSRLAMLRDMVI